MNLRSELFADIKDSIDMWQIAPVHVSVFGSTARGDGDVDSDIDMLVVRPANIAPDEQRWQAQVDALRELIEGWTGNHAVIADLSEMELAELRDRQQPIVDELRSDAVVIEGSDVTTLLESA